MHLGNLSKRIPIAVGETATRWENLQKDTITVQVTGDVPFHICKSRNPEPAPAGKRPDDPVYATQDSMPLPAWHPVQVTLNRGESLAFRAYNTTGYVWVSLVH